MPNIWNDSDRAELVRRALTLTPAHTARWGTFSVGGMLAHLNDSTRMASGELLVTGKAPAFLKWRFVRYLFIYVLPMPKGAPTAPELLGRTAAADVVSEQQQFETLFDALARRESLAASHPAFGAMSRDDWGALVHKHVDHHLRQFGA